MSVTRRSLLAVPVAALLGAAGPGGYPQRTVRIIVPFPPGGTTDFVARLVAVRLTGQLGRNVIIENKPGASGAVGTEMVARAAPTGETLVFATINMHGINSAVFKSLSYDPVADFAPVTEVVSAAPTSWSPTTTPGCARWTTCCAAPGRSRGSLPSAPPAMADRPACPRCCCRR